MSLPVTRKYPFDALAEVMGLSGHQASITLGLSGSTEQEYRRDGMSELVADRVACRAGFHPSLIWPDWMDNQMEDVAAQKRAKNAEYMRKKYKRSKRQRDREREKARRYYQSTLEYSRAVRKRYREEHREQINAGAKAYYYANREAILAKRRARREQEAA